MKRCVIYSRVSADHQDYKRQTNELLGYANDEGYEIDPETEVFAETISATKKGKELKNRGKFSEMRAHIRKHNIKTILMWEVSRLARNAAKALTALEELKGEGVNVHFYIGGLDSINPEKWLTIQILTAVAEQEAEYLKKRVKSGRITSAEERGTVAGYWGRSIPYGYESVKATEKSAGILTIHKDESEVIRKIFNWADGVGEPEPVSMREIAIRLNRPQHLAYTRWRKEGKKYKDKRTGEMVDRVWKTNAISTILRNPTYKGKRPIKIGEKPPKEPGGEPEKIIKYINVPRIIDPIQWERVQTLIRKRQGSKNNAIKYNYLLKNKIFCGYDTCKKHYGCASEKRYGGRTYYRCYGSNDINPKRKCTNGQFSGFVLDEGIYSLLFQHQGMFDKMKQDAISIDDIKTKEEELDIVQQELQEHKLYLRGVLRSGATVFEVAHPGNGFREYNKAVRRAQNAIGKTEANITRSEYDIEFLRNIENINKSTFINEIGLYETKDFNRVSDFVFKYVSRVDFYKIKKSFVDYTELLWYKINRQGYFERIDNAFFQDEDGWKIHLPNGKDRFGFVEIYAFGSPFPLKGLFSNHTKLFCDVGETLKVSGKGELRWTRRDFADDIRQEKLRLYNAKIELEETRSLQSN